MYRSPHLLGRQTTSILRTRSRVAEPVQTRGLSHKCNGIQLKGRNVRSLSTGAPKERTWLKYAAGVLVLGGGVTLGVKYFGSSSDGVSNDLLPVTEVKVDVKEHEEVIEEEVVAEEEVKEELVLETEHQEKEELIVEAEPEEKEEVILEVETEEKQVVETEEETEVLIQADEQEEEVHLSVEQTDENVAEEYVIIESEDVPDTQAADEETLKQQQLQILAAAYENLRIILDDTITTKTSAVRMLHGYITQFSQALLVPNNDPAYGSLWDAISTVDHSIHESMDLVKTKETEVDSHVESINGLISDVRKYGTHDIADKAEKLVARSNEHLVGCDSEMELLTKKVNILLGVRDRVNGSPENLQNYLRGFVPDLMKLLDLKEIDVEKLSAQDALLLLSMRRQVLVYTEHEQKEAEQKMQFEATLQQEKENVWKEADEHLHNVVEKLEVEKNNELNETVEELKELHTINVEEELNIQFEAHQQELHEETTKLESELTAQYKTELEFKLGEQENRHRHEVDTNFSYLQGIEVKIADVLEIDAKSQKNQHLWAAVHALYNSLNDIAENGRTKKLTSEMSNILQCDESDDLLTTIIQTVPERAANRGIVPESVLVQHFTDTKRLCKNVAMVKDGSTFLTYVFSYVKSFFVVSQFYQNQLTDDIDIETLGPYEILEKAEYYVKHGDLEQAVKFMSQLKGIPRKLCADWVEEVRLLLETKQSANLLMAYVGSLIAGFE